MGARVRSLHLIPLRLDFCYMQGPLHQPLCIGETRIQAVSSLLQGLSWPRRAVLSLLGARLQRLPKDRQEKVAVGLCVHVTSSTSVALAPSRARKTSLERRDAGWALTLAGLRGVTCRCPPREWFRSTPPNSSNDGSLRRVCDCLSWPGFLRCSYTHSSTRPDVRTLRTLGIRRHPSRREIHPPSECKRRGRQRRSGPVGRRRSRSPMR